MKPADLREHLYSNPSKRKIADAVVLFADVMDSATISDILDPLQYDAFLSEFQSVAAKTIKHDVPMSSEEYFVDVRGDEACLVLYSGDLGTDIRVALTIAARIKAAFLAANANRKRLANGRNFFDIGIGIHTGRITLGVRHDPVGEGTPRVKKIKPEGYTINLAKRVESVSRDGLFSHITVSGDAKALAEESGLQMAFHDMGQVLCKGILHRSPVYEVKSPIHIEESWPARIIQTDDELKAFQLALKVNRTSLWLIMAIAHYFYDQEDYAKAQEHYEAALLIEPEYPIPSMYLGRTFYRKASLSAEKDRRLFLHRAKQYLEKAVKFPTIRSVTAHDFLAVVHRRLGEYRKAIEEHRKALMISPGSVWACNALAYTIAEARIAKEEVDLHEADKLISSLLKDPKLKGDYGYLLHHTAGLINSAKGTKGSLAIAIHHYDQAIEACQRITSPKKKCEKTAELQFHKGIALHEQWSREEVKRVDDLSRARDQLHEAIDTFRELHVKDCDPYWSTEATRRMGEIDVELGHLSARPAKQGGRKPVKKRAASRSNGRAKRRR